MRVALSCLAFCALTFQPALADAGRIRRSTPYADVRETLQRLGYQPFMMPGADVCDPDDARCYPEIENCAKSRTWSCTYTWRRGKMIVEIETHYATPVVTRSECVVNCGRAADARQAARAKSADNDP